MRKSTLIVLIVLILGATVSFGFLIYQEQNNVSKLVVNQQIEHKKAYPEDLKGAVYLTLKEKEKKSSKEDKSSYGLYKFDFQEGKLVEEYFVENCKILGGEFDLVEERMLISQKCNQEDRAQIYAIDQEKKLTKITNSNSRTKKEASWSDDSKKVVFMATSDRNQTFNINSWNIVVSDLNGNEEIIANGAHPFFSPDGKKVLFLKDNGINLVNIETKEITNIFNFKADVTFQLDLSIFKDRLVISDPVNKNIKIFKINSWKNFNLEEIQEIKTLNSAISWPKFSPYDDKYLIYEEFFNDGIIELVVYDLENLKRYTIKDLSFYEHGFMWINDWK